MPNSNAKRYIMIGAPITSVRAPPLLEAQLAKAGVEARVEVQHVEPRDLGASMGAIKADRTIDGLVVTMPHKRAVIPHLDDLSSTAMLVGSVNTIKRLPSGELVGAQFDGEALVNALLTRAVPLGQSRVALLGLGGAGTAIAHALASHGVASLAIADTGMNTQALRDAIGALGAAAAGVAEPWTGPRSFDLLINATPVGMTDGDPSPFPADLIAAASWVADIVADPLKTRLASQVKDAGVPLITGREMVIGQVKPICAWLLHQHSEQ
ncbi:MAG: shikimate dehydrogenase family protein [Alphaproteobacteria bacterium]